MPVETEDERLSGGHESHEDQEQQHLQEEHVQQQVEENDVHRAPTDQLSQSGEQQQPEPQIKTSEHAEVNNGHEDHHEILNEGVVHPSNDITKHEPMENDHLLATHGTNGKERMGEHEAGAKKKDIAQETREICVELAGEETKEGKVEEENENGGVHKRACDIRCVVIGLLVVVIMVGGASVAILAHRFKTESSDEFHFSSYYSDNMVLQRYPHRAVVWGYGPLLTENTSVTLRVEAPKHRVMQYNALIQITAAGQVWRIVLDEIKEPGPYTITAELDSGVDSDSERRSISLHGVLFGDVWLCAGQDNMQMSTEKPNPTCPGLTSGVYNFRGQCLAKIIWLVHTFLMDSLAQIFRNCAGCSGQALHENLKYPIGLVSMTYNGSSIEDWTSPAAQDECGRHVEPSSRVWNAMVHPILDVSIYGLIWYQGEKNALDGGHNYNCSLVQLVHHWREETSRRTRGSKDPLFPVGIVQLAPYRDLPTSMAYGFPNIRWRQTANYGYLPNQQLTNTFLAVTIDLQDSNSTNIISPHKEVIANRLVNGALAIAYRHKDVEHQGPLPSQYQVMNNDHTVTIFFNQTSIDMRSPNGFELCCSDNRSLLCQSSSVFKKVTYAPGREWIDSPIIKHSPSSVTLSSKACSTTTRQYIVGLRYAWSGSPCAAGACAIYASTTRLPMPPYIHQGLIDDGMGHSIGRDQVDLM